VRWRAGYRFSTNNRRWESFAAIKAGQKTANAGENRGEKKSLHCCESEKINTFEQKSIPLLFAMRAARSEAPHSHLMAECNVRHQRSDPHQKQRWEPFV